MASVLHSASEAVKHAAASIMNPPPRSDYRFSVLTNKSPAEALTAVTAAVSAKKMAVLYHFDVNSTLSSKGQLPLDYAVHILEVCSAPIARQALGSCSDVAYFLPCKVVVRQVPLSSSSSSLASSTSFTQGVTGTGAEAVQGRGQEATEGKVQHINPPIAVALSAADTIPSHITSSTVPHPSSSHGSYVTEIGFLRPSSFQPFLGSAPGGHELSPLMAQVERDLEEAIAAAAKE